MRIGKGAVTSVRVSLFGAYGQVCIAICHLSLCSDKVLEIRQYSENGSAESGKGGQPLKLALKVSSNRCVRPIHDVPNNLSSSSHSWPFHRRRLGDTGSLQVLSEPSDKLRAMSQKLSVKNKVGLGNMPIWLYTLYSTLYVHLAS